jgi:hypothetical protein
MTTRDAPWGLLDPDEPADDFDPERDLTDPDDRDWLAEWYEQQDATADRHEERRAVAETEGRAPSHVDEDRQEAVTKLDVLRRALLDSKGLDHLASPRALIDHILYFDTPSWIIGRPGCGKSFVALDWAAHVGSGERWNGFDVVQTNVIYVSPESPGGIKLRKQAWEASQGHRMDGVYFLPLPINAINAGEFSALAALALEVHAGLIILDTQARMTVGLEENSSKDMGVFVDKLDRLRDKTHACILTVHHTPRGADHLRGSTALEGAAGTIVTVKKVADEITLSADPEHGGKTKDVAPFEDVLLRLVPYGDAAIVSAMALDHVGDRQIPTDVERSLRTWWQQHGSEAVSSSLLVRTEVITERTFFRYKKMLIDQGVLTKTGRGNQTRYAMVEGNPYVD